MGRRVAVWVSEMSVAATITPECDDAGIIHADIAGEHFAPMRGQSFLDRHPKAEPVARAQRGRWFFLLAFIARSHFDFRYKDAL